MMAKIQDACREIVKDRRKGNTSSLPRVFAHAERSVPREPHGDCGGRYARYAKSALEGRTERVS